jgi:nucleotide-binding universal stress UspA family protein
MKDILVVIGLHSDSLSHGTSYALSLAQAYGAQLSALRAERDAHSLLWPEPDNMQGDEVPVERLTESERLAQGADVVLSAAKDVDVPCEIISYSGSLSQFREKIVACAQVRDVLVVDVFGSLRRPRLDLVESALFASGRPVILVPQPISAFFGERVLIAWDATRSAVRAVHDALPILVRARDVTVVSVMDDKTFSRPKSGEMLCRYLARWGIAAQAAIVTREDRNVGTALLAFARHANADLLVMGGFAHAFESELMFGSATRDIFQAELEIPVLLSH